MKLANITPATKRDIVLTKSIIDRSMLPLICQKILKDVCINKYQIVLTMAFRNTNVIFAKTMSYNITYYLY